MSEINWPVIMLAVAVLGLPGIVVALAMFADFMEASPRVRAWLCFMGEHDFENASSGWGQRYHERCIHCGALGYVDDID